jgi:hypothetical protein
VTGEQLDQAQVAAIAVELGRRARGPLDLGRFGERKDLEPAAVGALAPTYGARVEKDRDVPIPRWPSVGRADLVVWENAAAKRVSWVAELKWCGPATDLLYEGVWDLFKMALARQRDEQPRAYLLSGAEQTVWERSPFACLLEDEEHDTEQLCSRELTDRKRTLAWDAALHGGWDRFPDGVPARIATRVVGRAAVGDCELRAAEVSMVGREWVPFVEGWPHGRRPARAKHPLAPPPAA